MLVDSFGASFRLTRYPPIRVSGAPKGWLMADYPLVFTFNDTVSGNGFLAGVTITGRAVMAKEDEFWWMSGVRPAALTAKGETAAGSYLEFRRSFTSVLFDTASFSGTFE